MTPAFPTLVNIAYNSDWQSDDGMSLRDYFANTVVPTTYQQATLMANTGRIDDDYTFKVAAGLAYAMADAMLEAREK